MALLGPMVMALGTAALADCPTGSCPAVPSTPGSSGNTTVGGSNANATANPNNNQSTTSNAVANPLGQNTNVQVNNNSGGDYGFGGGIKCQGATIAANAFQANSAVSGYIGSTNTYGGTVGIIIPMGGPSYRNCVALSAEILTQRRLDTCLTVVKNLPGYKFDPAVFPEQAHYCNGLIPPPSAPAAVAPQVKVIERVVKKIVEVPAPSPPIQPVPKTIYLSNFTPPSCRPDIHRDRDLRALHKMRHQLRTYHPSKEFIALHKKLSKACNVTSAEIVDALDG